MGRVFALQPVPAPVSTKPHVLFVESAYEKLAALPGFIVRPEQRELSLALAASMVKAERFAAEAPTGTGKTIAYLVGALAAAEELKPLDVTTVVVATATIGLQSQIMTGDLPTLVKAGIIQGGDYTLAKGRGRYFCIDSARRVTEGKEASSQVDIFDEAKNAQNEGLVEVNALLAHWNEGHWAGDFDSYPNQLPASTANVAASAQTCLTRNCEHFAACPFFMARRTLSTAKIIVANHDLVLSDLAMDREGATPLFQSSRYLVVFDEAHHLPLKAQDAGSANVDLHAASEAFKGLAGYNKVWTKHTDFVRLFERNKLDENAFSSTGLTGGLQSLLAAAEALPIDDETGHLRFSRGGIPDSLARAVEYTLSHVDRLLDSFVEAQGHLKGSNIVEKNPSLKPQFSDLLYAGAYFSTELQRLRKALVLFSGSQRAVRWLSRRNESISLNSSPLDGGSVLKDLLWDSTRAIPAMVSATLRDFGGYERFKQQIGLEELKTFTLKPIFPYHECELWLANMTYSPRQDERAKYEAELFRWLPLEIDAQEATLILFPSRSLMGKLLPLLRKRLGHAMVRAQTDKGIKELVKDHKEAVDAGQGSVLCGLATMAEGLDLPGKYCTHVVICTLPFSVPTSPVEQEMQDELGKDYFSKKALPDTLVKLIQMVGRLMRRESDRGRITIFDNRTINSRWGNQLMKALPPFSRKILAPPWSVG